MSGDYTQAFHEELAEHADRATRDMLGTATLTLQEGYHGTGVALVCDPEVASWVTTNLWVLRTIRISASRALGKRVARVGVIPRTAGVEMLLDAGSTILAVEPHR